MLKIILDKILNKNTLIFIGASLFVLLFLRQCNQIENLKIEVEQTQKISNRNLNNYKASLDTIANERNYNNELVSSIRSYEVEINYLTNENNKLLKSYRRSLNINKEIQKINSVISADLEIKDSIIGATTVATIGDTINLKINDDRKWDKYNWRRFDGEINLLRDSLDVSLMSSNFNIYQGISLKAGILQTPTGDILKITSPYPNLEFTNIENINLVNDRLNRPMIGKSGWSLGFGVGYGLNLAPERIITVGPTIGVGLFWSPKWLRF